MVKSKSVVVVMEVKFANWRRSTPPTYPTTPQGIYSHSCR